MRFSIIILSYNYEAFVESAIRSALAQDWEDLEVIVVDDGSSDRSPEIIARYQDRVAMVFKPNGGQPSAYNAGFERVTGDVVIFLDADDTLDPDACQQIARAFEPSAGGAPDEVAKVHYALRLVDAAGRPLGGVLPTRLAEGDVGREQLLRGQLYQSAPGSGNAYRKRALDRLMPLPLDPDDPHGGDFFLIHGTSLLGKVRIAGDGPLGAYRVHRSAFSTQVTFGNSAPHFSEPEASYRRYARLRAWIAERLGGAYTLPAQVRDFSLEKQGYATTLFGSDEGYLPTLKRGTRYLTKRVLPSIWSRPGSPLARVALTGWAVSVLVLPRPIGSPLARYVCNPASR